MVFANCKTFQPVLGPHLYKGVTLSSRTKSGKFFKMQQLLNITIRTVLKPRDPMLPAEPEVRNGSLTYLCPFFRATTLAGRPPTHHLLAQRGQCRVEVNRAAWARCRA